MFLAIFWSAFIPIGALIVSLISDWLIQSIRQLRPYAWSRVLEPHLTRGCSQRKSSFAALGLSLMLAVGMPLGTAPDASKGSPGPAATSAGGQLAQYCAPSEQDGVPAQTIFCQNAE